MPKTAEDLAKTPLLCKQMHSNKKLPKQYLCANALVPNLNWQYV